MSEPLTGAAGLAKAQLAALLTNDGRTITDALEALASEELERLYLAVLRARRSR